MISRRYSVPLVVVTTIAMLVALLALNPFAYARRALILVAGVGSEDALVKQLWLDPATQETSRGERPRASLEILRSVWGRSAATRALLIGNSQTLAVILAPGEAPTQAVQKTYPDFVFEKLRECRQPVDGYRLAAPNLSYMEAVFYLDYVLTKPELRPSRLVLQLNYESFRKPGVRDGMLELLSDEDFRRTAEKEAASTAPYAGTFQGALERFATNRARTSAATAPVAGTTKTGIAESYGFGNRFEQATRRLLGRIPVWRRRTKSKTDLLDVLYLLRVYVLRITPTTRRSIGGATLAENHSAVERIGELCANNGIELVLFNAPQNPLARLYRTDTDRQTYRRIVESLAATYGTAFFDFEDSIPKEYWGRWIDGPDPIHLGRAGHSFLAKLMLESGVFGAVN